MKTQPTKKPHIVLWADDDLDDLFLMRETLEQLEQNHRVAEVHNGRQVLDYLAAVKNPEDYPCLIVLDINMPVLSGRETLAIIRSIRNYDHIPVVMFSTSSSELDRAFCRQFKSKLYTKPHSCKELERLIATILTHCNNYTEVGHSVDLAL